VTRAREHRLLRALGRWSWVILSLTPLAVRPPSVAEAQSTGSSARQLTNRGFAATKDVTMRIYVPSGRVRLTTWIRDSIHLQGTVAASSTQYGGGTPTHVKFGVEARTAGDPTLPNAEWDITVPRGARVWIKMIDGQLDVAGVTGELELYTVRGEIRVHDVAGVTSIESIDAPVTVSGARGDLRVRGSRGAVKLEGIKGTASVATVSGPVTITSCTIDGRVETIGGEITVTGGSLNGALMELQTHSGAITLALDARQTPLLDLSTRAGPVQGDPLKGSAKHGQLSARSFKGRITVRARP